MILFICNDFHQVAWCIISILQFLFIYWENFYEIKVRPFFLIWNHHFARMYSYCLPNNHFHIGFDLRGKRHLFIIFISLMGLLISIGLLLFQWNEKPIISFLSNFQTNSFNRIFRLFITLCLLLCIPLSIEYIKCIKMPMIEFIIFVLTTTIGRMFLCGANDLIIIFVA
jgi:hypothetical protein